MANGIVSIGSYVPYYRIERKLIGTAWDRGAMKGEKAVSNIDEDSLTMAVEAAINSLANVKREDISALYFATNTSPYAEKSAASIIATVCDLPVETFTVDICGTTRAGSAAMKMALDAASGTDKNILITAADTRSGYPKSDQEQLFGDAAAAVIVGQENIIAELVCSYSITTEIVDVWRNTDETYVNYGEGRFIMDKGYIPSMRKAVKGVMGKAAAQAKDFAKIILSTPGMKDGESIAKKEGFTVEQIQNNFMLEVGNCGAAQPLLMLADAIETSTAGDLILLAAYGNGADAFVFKVTEQVDKLKKHNPVAKTIATKRNLASYTKFLSFSGNLEANPGEPFRTFPSNAAYMRDTGAILKLTGSKCKKCGTGIYPVNRICPKCTSKDDFEVIRLSERKAKVFTYSIDALAGSSEDPLVVQTVADDAEGYRYYLIMTDFDKTKISIGMEVEFTFRKMYVGGNYINYYWKCRPVQRGTEQ